jgi:hypothetical protein
MEQIIPDDQSFKNVERDNPKASDAEKYRLMQADTLLRLTKAESMSGSSSARKTQPPSP